MNCPHCSSKLVVLNNKGDMFYCAVCEHNPRLWAENEEIIETGFRVVKNGEIILAYYFFKTKILEFKTINPNKKLLARLNVPIPTSQEVSIYLNRVLQFSAFL